MEVKLQLLSLLVLTLPNYTRAYSTLIHDTIKRLGWQGVTLFHHDNSTLNKYQCYTIVNKLSEKSITSNCLLIPNVINSIFPRSVFYFKEVSNFQTLVLLLEKSETYSVLIVAPLFLKSGKSCYLI